MTAITWLFGDCPETSGDALWPSPKFGARRASHAGSAPCARVCASPLPLPQRERAGLADFPRGAGPATFPQWVW